MFMKYQNDDGHNEPFEKLPAAADTYKAGQLLSVTAGNLSKLTAATRTTPPYLCVSDCTVANNGDELTVVRVNRGTIYETQLSAATEGAKMGAKLQISAGGEKVDGAAAGTFEVVYAEGTDEGDTVRGRFN